MNDKDALPPPTLEILDEQIGKVEDLAAEARDDVFAVKFLLFNLMLRMELKGTLNAQELMDDLRQVLPAIEKEHLRAATNDLLDELLLHVGQQSAPARLFH